MQSSCCLLFIVLPIYASKYQLLNYILTKLHNIKVLPLAVKTFVVLTIIAAIVY